jgi:hypothetical protein
MGFAKNILPHALQQGITSLLPAFMMAIWVDF